MARIKPFMGYRFCLEKPEDLEKFIAPPYDMLSEEMIDDLYDKDKYNIVRIIQNRAEKTDEANADRHQRAAETLVDWIASGVLCRDEESSVYIYEQRFSDTSTGEEKEIVRTGVIVLVNLVEFKEKVILPHEATLSGPKKDRYELLDATRTCTEQIFGLLDDDGRFYSLLRNQCVKKPEGVFTDSNGVVHSLFRCYDQNVISKLVTLAQGRTILIADGHHRYETALNFYRNNHQEAFSSILMTLVSTADPGLIIRPFHRLIRKEEAVEEMQLALSKYFSMHDYGEVTAEEIYRFISSEDNRSFMFLDSISGHLYGCILNEEGTTLLSSIFTKQSMQWKLLPVSMINVIVIHTILGLPLDGHILHDVVEYINVVEDAVDRCRLHKTYYGGFFIRPTSIETIGTIVASGERMPQKSTNFYPKMYSGLVMHKPEPL